MKRQMRRRQYAGTVAHLGVSKTLSGLLLLPLLGRSGYYYYYYRLLLLPLLLLLRGCFPFVLPERGFVYLLEPFVSLLFYLSVCTYSSRFPLYLSFSFVSFIGALLHPPEHVRVAYSRRFSFLPFVGLWLREGEYGPFLRLLYLAYVLSFFLVTAYD